MSEEHVLILSNKTTFVLDTSTLEISRQPANQIGASSNGVRSWSQQHVYVSNSKTVYDNACDALKFLLAVESIAEYHRVRPATLL